MQGADVAVVIVNYRTPELTARCLDFVDRAAGGMALELIVVDNASNDGSPAHLRERRPDAVVVERPSNDGFAAGVNAGFAASSAPVVVVLNPDTEPQPGSIARLVEHLNRRKRTGVAAPLLTTREGAVQRSVHCRFPSLLTLFVDFCVPVGHVLALRPDWHPHELSEAATERGPAVEHATGAALAIRRATYEDAGPLDEGFFLYLEETEWQQRVRARGWSIEVVPAARVVHIMRAGAPVEAIAEHYLSSVYRFMRMQGHREQAVDAVLAVGSGLSRAAMRTIGAVSPRRREASAELLAFHRSVSRYVRQRRAAR